MNIIKGIWYLILIIYLVLFESCTTMNISDNKNNISRLAFTFPSAVNQWTLEKTEPDRYNAETLYDYIDGNAEVYRSLGVKEVWAYRWTNPQGIEIFMDIFDMGDSASAYGAYHHDIRDQKDIGLGVESERMKNSLAFWKDRYFVSIVGMGDSEELNTTVMELGRIIDQQIPNKGKPPSIIQLLPEKGQVKSHIHYFEDYDLLKVHYFITDENILQLGQGTEGILSRYFLSELNERFNIIIIKYPDKNKTSVIEHNFKQLLDQAMRNLKEEERNKKFGFKSIAIHACKNYLILIVDWKNKETVNLYLREIEQNIKR